MSSLASVIVRSKTYTDFRRHFVYGYFVHSDAQMHNRATGEHLLGNRTRGKASVTGALASRVKGMGLGGRAALFVTGSAEKTHRLVQKAEVQ